MYVYTLLLLEHLTVNFFKSFKRECMKICWGCHLSHVCSYLGVEQNKGRNPVFQNFLLMSCGDASLPESLQGPRET